MERMRPQSAKAKGRRLQQAVVEALLEAFPHLTADDVRSTPMGAPGEDVQLSPAARAAVPFSFECKNCERVNVWDALGQAAANARGRGAPALVLKRNRHEPHVVLPLAAFVPLLAAAQKNNLPPAARHAGAQPL